MAYKCWYCRKGEEIICPECNEKYKGQLSYGTQPSVVEKINLGEGVIATKKQLAEMDRRVIIKHNMDGSYVLGRKGENGKIQERHPNYA